MSKKPYKFRFEQTSTKRRIFTQFRDGRRKVREVEVSQEVYIELVSLNRSIRNLEACEERHNEYREISEEEIALCELATSPSAESEALNNFLSEQLTSALKQLPQVQARRYLLSNLYGYTYAEIARFENCSRSAVEKSVAHGKKNLKRILENRLCT